MVVHDGHPGPVKIAVEPEFLEWLTDPARNGGGAIMDFGCYGADLMTWLMQGEPPISVTAVTQQLQPDVYPRVDDEATIVVTYPRAQGIIQASWNWPFSRKDTYVYGEKGTVFALDSRRVRYRPGDAEKEIEAPPPPPPADEPFAYLAAVVRGAATVAPYDLSSLPVNLTVMEILDAARESARTERFGWRRRSSPPTNRPSGSGLVEPRGPSSATCCAPPDQAPALAAAKGPIRLAGRACAGRPSSRRGPRGAWQPGPAARTDRRRGCRVPAGCRGRSASASSRRG